MHFILQVIFMMPTPIKKKKKNMVDHFSFEGNPFGSVFPKFFAYGLNTYSIVHILLLAKAFQEQGFLVKSNKESSCRLQVYLFSHSGKILHPKRCTCRLGQMSTDIKIFKMKETTSLSSTALCNVACVTGIKKAGKGRFVRGGEQECARALSPATFFLSPSRLCLQILPFNASSAGYLQSTFTFNLNKLVTLCSPLQLPHMLNCQRCVIVAHEVVVAWVAHFGCWMIYLVCHQVREASKSLLKLLLVNISHL